MELIFSILTFVFVALLIAGAVTIGFSLLVWCLVAGAVLSLVFAIQRRVSYWRFVRESENEAQIIEGEYKDLTDARGHK